MRWLIVFIFFVSVAHAQHIIEGKIIDAETKKPVSFASIIVLGTSKGTSSNLDGQFTLAITEEVSLKITSVGYESAEIKSSANLQAIALKPTAVQLGAVVVFNKKVNPRKIVRMAFAAIRDNYDTHPFLEKFFYRHYCKDNEAYGRLIEAFVEVWKGNGYQLSQNDEEVRVTQLRRSLDKTTMAQGHEPMSLSNILRADLVGHQARGKSEHLSFYSDISHLQSDFSDFDFMFDRVTTYDGQDVYQIDYTYKKDSVLLTSGKYQRLASVEGTLFIAMDSYAFVKAEETKRFGESSIRTLAYYRKFNNRYYPYHLIREGQNYLADDNTHSFRIDLTSVEIERGAKEKFAGQKPTREQLLSIPYDSAFWNNNSILKTTPLEDEIIRDLGGGFSLDKQFDLYRQYELNTHDGGSNGEEKFKWLRNFSKEKQPLYLFFWSSDCALYVRELDAAKELQKKYRNKILFVFLSVDDDETLWQQTISKYSLFSEGIINYRIGGNSDVAKQVNVTQAPTFRFILRNGDYVSMKPPSNLSDQELKAMLK
ncbi:MAG TPA: carboxypeptidase-like regulatory domain-containing protein [Cyclobacteriaceae bacterium]|jgi:thiol-disulfide isomerase/thioredoxin|nr:carboxypeptidase-like regulatory domain-containing protein [Cyclobacteriaceae bacterium]